ncbi:dethiobiotin synthetase [Muriicola jejuensis]|uniref:ATP-dependent dethiobiotin synthetase BioD n=1 Tax=Muriicola jejuensis TaxID=504488 RepID=A0A6P0UB14_9FLAO|nr:dethiobiotin synthase [Muriicola jejuensis]NER10227.1 dethiobiotin synthase [Muriicola jejuensis]SMP01979.1 dethiobiotin synthetase [Muriicola jejuensis]
MKRIFVTGISTEVGKTLASAIIVEALEADYWKPVQAGDLDYSDNHKVHSLISNQKTVIHNNSYALRTPMSPHAAAEIDGIRIERERIVEPETGNHLVIEGAGGLLVPLNDAETISDLIKPHYKVLVVSRHYLGSINHSLLTIEALRNRGFEPVILFSGNEHPTTEQIILSKTGVRCIGRISEEDQIDRETVRRYASQFRDSLLAL